MKEFPKIFTLGERWITEIWDGIVEVTEKVDGSQFGFGKINGELHCRSKGTLLWLENPDKLFWLAVDYVKNIADKIPDNTCFYAEYLQKKKHNTLSYDRVPKNNLALFGVCEDKDKFISDHATLTMWANELNIDVVPLLVYGNNLLSDEDKLKWFNELLETDSFLGNTKIEGFVVKNYSKPFMLGGRIIPLMMGKYVSEKFKEKHRTEWTTGTSRWDLFKESYKTEARWLKAVQHLRDDGKLENSPRDIGALIKSVHDDIIEECIDDVKEFLWNENKREFLACSTKGLPEWYKKNLALGD